MRFLLLFFALNLWAQPTLLKIHGATSTQVVFSYVSPDSSACTSELSESSTLSPLVYDVNTTFFSGSNSDANRGISGVGVAGKRIVVLGTQDVQLYSANWYSRALRADTLHYLKVSCTGGNLTTSFRTARVAGIAPRSILFNASAHGNFPVPSVLDWDTKSTPLIDPQTGVAIRTLTDPRDFGALTTDTAQAALNGTGWTNLSNLLSASTGSLATTSSTNPAFAWVDTTRNKIYAGWNASTWGGIYDLGVDVYGNSGAADTGISMCISVDSGQSCYTSTIAVTLPGSAALVGTYPATYPKPLFSGWTTAVPRELWTSAGTVTVATSTVTRVGSDPDGGVVASWFRKEWTAGMKIYIAGSSPTCTSNLCTIVSVESRNSLTISESLTIASAATYKSANFGVMVWKTNGTGTATISLGIREAFYKAYHQSTSDNCSPNSVSTTVDANGSPLGRTVTGYLCLVSGMNSGTYDNDQSLYFVGSSEYDVRLLSLLGNPINGGYRSQVTNPIRFSGSDPNSMYVSFTDTGKLVLYKLTYAGSYTTPSGIQNSYSTVGTVSGYTDPVTWTGVATGSSSITDQITNNTTFNATTWGAVSPSFAGIVDDYAIFYQNATSQDTPAAIFVFQASTGTYLRWVDTAKNSTAGFGFAAIHNINPAGHRVWISTGQTPYLGGSGNSSVPYGGPFLATVSGIYKSGVLSSNISLPWPPDSTYDNTCTVSGLTNCVKIRFANQPCSSYGTTAEKAASPCPGDASKSYIGRNIQVGDVFIDYTAGFIPDAEAFKVLSVTAISGNIFEVEALRDSANGYRCQGSSGGNNPFIGSRLCLATYDQATHLNNGWQAMFQPQCYMTVYNPADGTFTCRNEYYNRGHYDVSALPGDLFSAVGIQGFGGYFGQSSASDPSASGAVTLQQWPGWPSVDGTARNYVQSYISGSGTATTGLGLNYGVDWRHYNSSGGSAVESTGQTIGNAYTLTLQGGTSGVYKVASPTGISSIKTQPWNVWVGQYVLGDISSASTGDVITDATTWKFCYAFAANECRTGSSAGDFYVSVPGGLDTDLTTCEASQISYRVLCAFLGDPTNGQLVKLGISTSDPAGIRQTSLGWQFTRPGAQYVYSHARMFPPGNLILGTSHHFQGGPTLALGIDPGSIEEGVTDGNGFIPVSVKKSVNIVVEFGYNSSFYCTSRAESCFVQSATLQSPPFKYASESGATTAASSTVVIPGLKGRVLYYRVYTSGVAGDTQVVVVN